MKRRFRTSRRLLAPCIAAVLVTVSVAVPVLDAGRAAASTVLESEHHASSCLAGHDHTVCTQVASNLPLTAADATLELTEVEPRALATTSATDLRHHSPTGDVRPRAPPLART